MACVDMQPKKAITHFADYQKREKALADFVDDRLTGSTAGRMGKFAGRMGRRFV